MSIKVRTATCLPLYVYVSVCVCVGEVVGRGSLVLYKMVAYELRR